MSSFANRKPKYNFKFKPPVKVEKPNIVHVPREQWQKEKQPLFQWADNQAAKLGLNANRVHVLKTIISATDSKGVTHITLETIRNKLIQKLGKAAPSRQTIDRCIQDLVSKNSLKETLKKPSRA